MVQTGTFDDSTSLCMQGVLGAGRRSWDSGAMNKAVRVFATSFAKNHGWKSLDTAYKVPASCLSLEEYAGQLRSPIWWFLLGCFLHYLLTKLSHP